MNLFLKFFVSVVAAFLCTAAARAGITMTPWIPVAKGIDRAAGTNQPDGIIGNLEAANCVRIDLLEPSVRLFPSPPSSNYVQGSSETVSMSVSNYLKRHGMAVVTPANFYSPGDPGTEGQNCNPLGLLVCTGRVVSAVGDSRYASLLYTTSNVPIFIPSNGPPGTNLTGIYNAVSGFYPVLTNGVVIGEGALSQLYPDSTIHQLQPRTIHGLSANRRYLYLMIIDGRQGGYSDGATDTHSALWAIAFGMSDAINMDGGGSAAMYVANCLGNPVPLGRSSYTQLYGRERFVGAQFGVAAAPLDEFISSVSATAAVTTATITWNTQSNSTSRVEYGLNSGLGTFSALDSTMVTNHSVTLTGLVPGRQYFYRVISVDGNTVQYVSSCINTFNTVNPGAGVAFSLTNVWKYQTQNLDGVNWTAPGYNDGGWPQGPGALWAYNGSPPAYTTSSIPNFATGTQMPVNPASNNTPFVTYYFRKPFVFSNSPSGVTLTFSNFLDDGAVFYLNGTEISRTNMPAGIPNNTTFTPAGTPCPASGPAPSGNATCPLVFTLSNSPVLVNGTNLVAVEVHNFRSISSGQPSPDVVFESALYYSLPVSVFYISNVVVIAGETNATIAWETTSPASSQVQYGTTPSLGSSTTNDPTLVTMHFVTLTNLQRLTQYYFRIISSDGIAPANYDGAFSTVPYYQPLVPMTQSWRYKTNLTGSDWMLPGYNDSNWISGAGLLFVEDNSAVTPRNTALPDDGAGHVFPAYYFRTHFTVTQSLSGFALLLTNYVDDGAVFYLNGVEIQRVRMPAGAPAYTTLANGCPVNSCEATLDAPDIFRISGDALTNVVMGDNVLAAEVHQFTTGDDDIVFGSSIGISRALASETKLVAERVGTNVLKLSWAGSTLTLQATATLSSSNTFWVDLAGPVKTSPYYLTNFPGTRRFFRLRD